MKPLHPRLEISPSPPPDIHPAQVSSSSCPIDDCAKSNRRKIRSSSGDAVLVAYLDNGRRPDIARAAGFRALPIDEDNNNSQKLSDTGLSETRLRVPPPANSNFDAYSLSAMTRRPSLQQLPADPIHISAPTHDPSRIPREGPDITLSTRNLSINDDRPGNVAYALDARGPQNVAIRRLEPSPTTLLTPASTGLPPLQMDSPNSESSGQGLPVLPSIRSTLGDIDQIPSEPPTPADNDVHGLNKSGSPFTRSPPPCASCLPLISTPVHASPPVSPNGTLPRGLPSPRSIPATSPYSSFGPSPAHHRTATEYSSSADGQTPSTDISAPTPATTTSSAVDRMNIDGITNPTGSLYVCNYSGCTAPPFQTQYLLNSHANVHSSARPHYCPVQGCPRSEGGKGFKRKNEMIRHGLVHDSPGYVCPFCPDRDHKYPRPDNLQR